MKKWILSVSREIGLISGSINGYLLGRRLAKICRLFGWDDSKEIKDFAHAVMVQIQHKRYCVPMFMDEEDKE